MVTEPYLYPVKHICISDLCKEEILKKREICTDDLEVLLNFVDENTFGFMSSWRSMSPERIDNGFLPKILTAWRKGSARRADRFFKSLVFGNAKPKEIEELRISCRNLGITLDEIGNWSESGNRPNPEEYLPSYDLVFCYGRSAMESLYCGCDVILMHSNGTGDVVINSNFSELRRRNFGYTTCQGSQGVEGLTKGIVEVINARANGTLLLDTELRESLRSKPVLERLEEIYRESIDAWEKRKELYTPDDLQRADNHALSEYFMELRDTMRFV